MAGQTNNQLEKSCASVVRELDAVAEPSLRQSCTSVVRDDEKTCALRGIIQAPRIDPSIDPSTNSGLPPDKVQTKGAVVGRR